jgi:uncharacterized protein YjiS (DUF1127 family)
MIDTRKSAIPFFRPAPGGITRLVARVVQIWTLRRRARAQLGRLDAHILRDIGLSEDQARREAVKHFWIE